VELKQSTLAAEAEQASQNHRFGGCSVNLYNVDTLRVERCRYGSQLYLSNSATTSRGGADAIGRFFEISFRRPF
jgi:hypothetical protein